MLPSVRAGSTESWKPVCRVGQQALACRWLCLTRVNLLTIAPLWLYMSPCRHRASYSQAQAQLAGCVPASLTSHVIMSMADDGMEPLRSLVCASNSLMNLKTTTLVAV